MFLISLIYSSKAAKSSLQSDQKWGLQRGTKVSARKSPLPAMRKLQCISSCNCVENNNQSENSWEYKNGCEVLIENSVTRVTVRHHEACRVMPNSYPSDGIFNLHRRTIMDFFFLHTLPKTVAFRLEYVLFYQFYAKITTFFLQEKLGKAPLLIVDVETFGGNWGENDVKTSKMTSKRQNDIKIVILTSCTRIVLPPPPPCKTTFPSPSRVCNNEKVCTHQNYRYTLYLKFDVYSTYSKNYLSPALVLYNRFYTKYLKYLLFRI